MNILCDFIFILHFYDELDFLNELKKDKQIIELYKTENLIKKTIELCNKNSEDNYTFIINNKEIKTDKDEFWEKWNENLMNTIEV